MMTTATGKTKQPSSNTQKRSSLRRNVCRGSRNARKQTATAPRIPSSNTNGGAVMLNQTGMNSGGTASDRTICP